MERSQNYLVIFLLVVLAVFPVLPKRFLFISLIPVSIIVTAAFLFKFEIILPLGLFSWVCLFGKGLDMPSQIFFAAGLILFLMTERKVRGNISQKNWMKTWQLDRISYFLIAAFVILAISSLIIWYVTIQPDISHIIETFIPDWPVFLLFAGGFVFAIINAILEEAAYRGVVLDELERAFGNIFLALIMQAVAFGLLHINGFPSGWIGVGLATVYGLFMGLLRLQSRGLLAPVLAHILVDIGIVGLVIFGEI
jgi:hypothetical protein